MTSSPVVPPLRAESPGSAETATMARNVLRAMLISYVGFAASFLSSIVLARALGAEGKGAFSLFQASVTTVTVFAGFGIGHGQMYYAAKDPNRLPYFMPNGLIVSLVLGGGAATLYFLAGWVFNIPVVATLGWRAVVAGVLCVPVTALLAFQRQYLLVTHEYPLAKLSTALSLASPLAAFGLVYLLGRVTVADLVVAFVASQVACAIVFQLLLARRTRLIGRLSADFARMSARFGVRQYLSDLALTLTSRLDFFIIVYLLDKSALGIYSVAVGLAEVVSRLPSELGTMLFPAFASGKIPEGQAAPIVRRVFLLGVMISVLLALISQPLVVLLYGTRFGEAIAAFRWLLLGTLAWGTIFVTWNHASAGGRPGVGVPIFGAAAAVDAILCFVLLPRLGVLGASLAAAASYWFAALLFLRLFCRRERCTLREALVPKLDDVRWLLRQLAALATWASRALAGSRAAP